MVIKDKNLQIFLHIAKNATFTAPKICEEIFQYLDLPHIKIENATINHKYILLLTDISSNLSISFSNKYMYKDMYAAAQDDYIVNTIVIRSGILDLKENLNELNAILERND